MAVSDLGLGVLRSSSHSNSPQATHRTQIISRVRSVGAAEAAQAIEQLITAGYLTSDANGLVRRTQKGDSVVAQQVGSR